MTWEAKVELYEQIWREYEFGVGTIKGVARQFGVHRRMVREAIDSALPPPRKKPVRPRTKLTPAIAAPAAYARPWSREEGLVEIVRGRLEGEGPLTEAGLAEALGIQTAEIGAALIAQIGRAHV